MAWQTWKRIEKSSAIRKARLFLKQLRGIEPWIFNEVSIPRIKLGCWTLSPDQINQSSVIYSFGIGQDIHFDLGLIDSYSANVFAFDPTPSTTKWLDEHILPEKFHFYPWALSKEEGTVFFYPRINSLGQPSETMYTMVADAGYPAGAVPCLSRTLKSIMEDLGHHTIDILKIDIEGAEYDVLDMMLDDGIRPRQLLVEFHHRFPGIGIDKTSEMVSKLRNYGYKVFDISLTGKDFSFILN